MLFIDAYTELERWKKTTTGTIYYHLLLDGVNALPWLCGSSETRTANIFSKPSISSVRMIIKAIIIRKIMHGMWSEMSYMAGEMLWGKHLLIDLQCKDQMKQ